MDRNTYVFKLYQQRMENGNSSTEDFANLWLFAQVFVALSREEIGSSENIAKARKFLIDRIRLLLLGYKELACAEPEEAELIDKFVWRLKNSEQLCLKNFLNIIESS